MYTSLKSNDLMTTLLGAMGSQRPMFDLSNATFTTETTATGTKSTLTFALAPKPSEATPQNYFERAMGRSQAAVGARMLSNLMNSGSQGRGSFIDAMVSNLVSNALAQEALGFGSPYNSLFNDFSKGMFGDDSDESDFMSNPFSSSPLTLMSLLARAGGFNADAASSPDNVTASISTETKDGATTTTLTLTREQAKAKAEVEKGIENGQIDLSTLKPGDKIAGTGWEVVKADKDKGDYVLANNGVSVAVSTDAGGSYVAFVDKNKDGKIDRRDGKVHLEASPFDDQGNLVIGQGSAPKLEGALSAAGASHDPHGAATDADGGVVTHDYHANVALNFGPQEGFKDGPLVATSNTALKDGVNYVDSVMLLGSGDKLGLDFSGLNGGGNGAKLNLVDAGQVAARAASSTTLQASNGFRGFKDLA